MPASSTRIFASRELRLQTRGEIDVDTDGRVLGEHAGVHHFTVGQRKGLGIAAGEPLYVIATEPDPTLWWSAATKICCAPGLPRSDVN